MKAYKENIIQDIVGELGNVGIGSAATSLSSLLGRQILTTTSQVNIIDEQTFIQWKDAYEQTIGILFPLEKELNGFALFLMDEKNIREDIASIHWIDEQSENDEVLEVLMEISSILISSYLSAVASYSNLHLKIRQPAISRDMKESIINEALSNMLMLDDEAIYLIHSLKISHTYDLILMLSRKSILQVLTYLEVRE
ncbi:chemotaxis protein CheC [Absiella sp. AM29-15]|uniref:chemotaxis protein CheC n=1 Tax=Absiella sp. AM29-15 TaxID=2292278 RepID=UPI000E3FA9E4|nr:chemotaxis protein CheC [Absiella sp. AM29-15]RGC53459.1 hypothetical protein DW761_03640 [Absiella sp. AM29-15]